MKHLLIALLLTITAFHHLQAQNDIAVTVKIDPRFEALSIFYFLAIKDSLDAPDQPSPSVYYRAVKQHFAPLLADKEWQNEVEELFVRACVARILAARNGAAAGERESNGQGRRYKNMIGLYNLLGKYNGERDKYPDISAFYPQIVDWFEKVAVAK